MSGHVISFWMISAIRWSRHMQCLGYERVVILGFPSIVCLQIGPTVEVSCNNFIVRLCSLPQFMEAISGLRGWIGTVTELT